MTKSISFFFKIFENEDIFMRVCIYIMYTDVYMLYVYFIYFNIL